MKITLASSKGFKNENQDSFGISVNGIILNHCEVDIDLVQNQVVVAVADGVSACKQAKQASLMAVEETLKASLMNSQEIREFMNELNEKIAGLEDGATTLNAVVLDTKACVAFNIGDSITFGVTKDNKVEDLYYAHTTKNYMYATYPKELLIETQIPEHELHKYLGIKNLDYNKSVGEETFIKEFSIDDFKYLIIASDGVFETDQIHKFISKCITGKTLSAEKVVGYYADMSVDNVTVICVDVEG